MKKIFGNTGGLKASYFKRLERLYRRRIPAEYIVTPELAREISNLSYEIRRQIGILVNRLGKIVYVIVGDYQQIEIPDLSEYRTSPGRLKGARCIHTHLNNESLTQDDITDLTLLKLDLIAAVTITKDGRPDKIHVAHILPKNLDGNFYHLLSLKPEQLDMGCLELIDALEDELAYARSLYDSSKGKERAILISVTSASKRIAQERLAELGELAETSKIDVVGTVLQQRKKVNPIFLMGPGKIRELTLVALQKAATIIVFAQELNPSQIRSITEKVDIKVIDRTQLILDIFAQNAKTNEGKLQVELAQLKYILPRLITKNTAMSRLTGGIGGRGPGETKLEISRRRVRDRIAHLEKAMSNIRKQRSRQKSRRNKRELPLISIIGYTNAGKSTLLNTLTKSNVKVEDSLFASLDPASRRLKFPKDINVIISDTVGFIKDLPKELMVAFKATLEELEGADLLLHVIDISNPNYKENIKSVEKILYQLELHHIPLINVLNKKDRVNRKVISNLTSFLNGIAISANDESTLEPLIKKMTSGIQMIREN